MQIESSFLRSRVARRVFVLFILCALLPVGALSLVSFTDVTNQLTQQSERRVRQESKAMGMAVYQRLLLLEAELLSISSQPRVTQPQPAGDLVPAPAFPATPGLSGMARVSPDGTAEVFLGEMRSVPSLSPAQWSILRQQKTLMMNMQDAGARRLFLVRLPDSTEQANVAEIRQEYVWDLAGSMTLPADMVLCVFGSQSEVLFCSQPLPEELRAEWTKGGATGRASLFEWRDADDSYIAGSWEIPLRFQFSAAPWTIVLSESQRSVLAPLADFRYRFVLVVVIALFCVALLSVSQIRKTMVPLEQLGEGTRRIAARNFSTPVEVQSGDEFESLASSFNAMASRLHQQFAQLATIHEIDRSVLSVLDPSRIIDTVLTRLREVSPCEGIAVLLVDSSDPARGWLYARSGAKNKPTTMTGVPVSDDERRMLVSHEGGSTLIGAEGAAAFATLCRAGISSLMVLPLFRSRDLLGAIAMELPPSPGGGPRAQNSTASVGRSGGGCAEQCF